MSAVQTITVDTLAQRLDAGHLAQLWNVLTDEYFTGALIPGSRRVPLDQAGREVADLALPRDAAIVGTAAVRPVRRAAPRPRS